MGTGPTLTELSWEEKGRQHYRNCLVNPEKAKPDYPTQDIHPPSAEAEFVRGFNAERIVHLGEQLSPDNDPRGSTWMEGY
jgi:hypothetical protein